MRLLDTRPAHVSLWSDVQRKDALNRNAKSKEDTMAEMEAVFFFNLVTGAERERLAQLQCRRQIDEVPADNTEAKPTGKGFSMPVSSTNASYHKDGVGPVLIALIDEFVMPGEVEETVREYERWGWQRAV